MASLPLAAATIAELVAQHAQAVLDERRLSATGNETGAQVADQAGQDVSAELRERLQAMVGRTPLERVLAAL